MSQEELTRRIELLEKDLTGQSRTIEERRSGIREEVAAIRAWVRRDLERFVDDVGRQLPQIIDEAKSDEVKVHLGSFLEKTLTEWAQAETKEIADALEALAEKTIALVREDARDVARRLGDTLGMDLKAPDVEVDTFRYDVGVFALLTIGVGVMFTNALLGGLLALAAPVLAVYMRDKVEAETRKKAKERAPEALKEAAAKIGPKLDEMIQEFASRLDAWVVTAGEELHREVIEVLRSARDERSRAEPGQENVLATCDQQADTLAGLTKKLEALRSDLWKPASADPPNAPTPAVPGLLGDNG